MFYYLLERTSLNVTISCYHYTAWFTYFWSFFLVNCTPAKLEKLFIFILLDRAFISVLNYVLFIWFNPHLDWEFSEILKALKIFFSMVIFSCKENISLKINLIVPKLVSDRRDLWESCLDKVLNKIVLQECRERWGGRGEWADYSPTLLPNLRKFCFFFSVDFWQKF